RPRPITISVRNLWIHGGDELIVEPRGRITQTSPPCRRPCPARLSSLPELVPFVTSVGARKAGRGLEVLVVGRFDDGGLDGPVVPQLPVKRGDVLKSRQQPAVVLRCDVFRVRLDGEDRRSGAEGLFRSSRYLPCHLRVHHGADDRTDAEGQQPADQRSS